MNSQGLKFLLLVNVIFLMAIISSGQEGIGGRVVRRPALGCACVPNSESDSQNSSRQKPSEKECREKGDVATVYNGKEVDKKAVILERPQPDFSSLHAASGRVVLKVVLCPHGSVGRVGIIIGASDQINDLAIKAAKDIKFEPAVKSGQQVAQYLQLEYSFGAP